MTDIIDVYRDCEKNTKLKSYEIPSIGKFRLSRSYGEIEKIGIGNPGLFPNIRIYDSVRDIWVCNNVFMTGSFPLHAGFNDYLIVDVYSSEDNLIPTLLISWRDKE